MEVMPDDLKFPKAVVARIIKDALPEGAKVSKEAQSAISRSAAIFILHATSFANDHAQSKKRKNVTAEDVFHAVRQLECEELEDSIIEGLEMFKKKRVDRLQKRSENNNKKKEIEKQAGTSSNAVESPEPGEEDEEEENEAMEVSDEKTAVNGEEEQQEQNGENEQEEEENEEPDEENNDDDDNVVEIDEEEDE